MLNIKISGFYDEISADLQTQIAVIKELGEEYLCPRLINGKNIASYTAEEFERDIYPALKAAGIKFSSIGSPIGKIQLDDEAAFAKQLKSLGELLKIARLMDCKYIRTFSFFVNPEDNYEAAFSKVVAKIREFVKLAEEAGVVLLHENEKHIYGDAPDRALRIYHEIGSPSYKLCYDASNYIQCKYDPVEAYEMTKEHTVYYHIKDCSAFGVEVPVGTGLGSYSYILSDLSKRDYEGFLTLEPHTAKYAILKPFVYFVPFVKLGMWKFFRGFRQIDKAMNVNFFKTVSRKTVFLWQHKLLKDMISAL